MGLWSAPTHGGGPPKGWAGPRQFRRGGAAEVVAPGRGAPEVVAPETRIGAPASPNTCLARPPNCRVEGTAVGSVSSAMRPCSQEPQEGRQCTTDKPRRQSTPPPGESTLSRSSQ